MKAAAKRKSFSDRKQIFENGLREEHEKDCLEWLGNIVIEEPSRRACQRFLEEGGFAVEDLSELMKCYYRRKAYTSFDPVILSIYINSFIKGWKQEQREGKYD